MKTSTLKKLKMSLNDIRGEITNHLTAPVNEIVPNNIIPTLSNRQQKAQDREAKYEGKPKKQRRDAPKRTSRKEKIIEDRAKLNAATLKGKKPIIQVKIKITESMMESRMKLPAKMYKDISVVPAPFVIVNKTQIPSIKSDGYRSTKIYPSMFGAELGDTVVFTYTGRGKHYNFEVIKAKQKETKPKKSTPELLIARDRESLPKKSIRERLMQPSYKNATETIDIVIDKYADLALANIERDYMNKMMVERLYGEVDARMFLTPTEIKGLNTAMRRLGVSDTVWVDTLNDEVFE